MGIAYPYGNIHHDQSNTLFLNEKIAPSPRRLEREYGIFPPNWKRTISWTRPPLLCRTKLQYRILRLSSTLADAEFLAGIHILEAEATWPRRPGRQLRISRTGHVMIESRCRVFGILEVRVGTVMCKWHFFFVAPVSTTRTSLYLFGGDCHSNSNRRWTVNSRQVSNVIYHEIHLYSRSLQNSSVPPLCTSHMESRLRFGLLTWP